MKRRWLLTLSVSFALLFSSSSIASAVVSVPITAENMAVHVNQAFSSLESGTVVGNTYIADGNAIFSGATKAKIQGLVYYNSGMSATYPLADPGWTGFSNQLKPISPTVYEGAPVNLIDAFPVITKYIPEYLQHWTTLANLTISENTHIGALNVGDKEITVDASAKDIYLVVDDLSFEWGKAIKLIGTHKLYLFIDEFTGANQMTIKNSKNKNNTDSEKVYILSNDDIGHVNLNLYAHVYYTNTAPLTPLGIISGSLVTNTTTLNIGTNCIINGLVYAPLASATVTNSGKIVGRIVADELVLSGSGRIEYNSCPLQLPTQFSKYEVTTTTNIPGAGTVSPASKAANYGEVVNFVATPNPGYRFTGFTSSVSSMVPDASGNITVTGAVTITAHFEATSSAIILPSVTPENPVNGILGEYYDVAEPIKPSALKLRRIDSRIAFNYGYEAPYATVEPDTFSMRWTGYIKPEQTGDYTFKTYSDDGIKVNIGGVQIIDRWGALSLDYTEAIKPVKLEAGKYYEITVEYQQLPYYAGVYLFWQSADLQQEIVPASAFYVTEADFNTYQVLGVEYNPVLKSGLGLANDFYTLSSTGGAGELKHSEINNIYYEWQGGAPGAMTEDAFYAEMKGYLEAKFSERTTLLFTVDDAIRVRINDELVLDEWKWHDSEMFEYSFDTVAGQKYKIEIEYADFGIGATCMMRWQGESVEMQVVPKAYLYSY